MNQQTVIVYVLFGALMAWSVYRRARRNIGRQPLRPRRAIVRLIILSIVSILLIVVGLLNPKLLLGFLGGLLPGAILGFVGLKLTKFETTAEGHFYTPDTRIGVALSVLLAGRLIYKLAISKGLAFAPSQPPPPQSPLTYLIIGLTFGYYIVYSIGLLVHAYEKYQQQNTVPPTLSV